MKKNEENKSVTVVKSHRAANIVVIVVITLAVLVLVATAVLSSVKVDPMRAFNQAETYYFYDNGSTSPEVAGDSSSQSKIRTAMGDMKFSIMGAILRGDWDYTYNFKRNDAEDKIEISAADLKNIAPGDNQYMIELVYPTVQVKDGALDYAAAQVMEVDDETVYYDRVKVVISDTSGDIGRLEIYPYLYARIGNASDIDGIASDTYSLTGINVRADTTTAYAALKELAKEFKPNV